MTFRIRNKIWVSFLQFLGQIIKDAMLFMVCFTPIIYGLLIKYVIPYLERRLTSHFGYVELLTPYYLIFDIFLAAMTPLMFCFVSAMVMLGEIDDGISKYLAVTPIGKRGYLVSRLGIPTLISIIVTLIVLSFFSLTKLSFTVMVIIAFVTAMLSLIESLLIITISNNKVEGMAITKLSSLLFLGIPAPFFITGGAQYLLFFLPSFWLTKFVIEDKLSYLIGSIVVAMIWILLLYKKFIRKIM